MIEWLVVPVAAVSAWGGAAWWLDAHGRRPPPRPRYDAIVVAGCRVMPDGRPSPALARRVRHAVWLYHQGVAPTLVFTGGLGQPEPPLSEAAASARLAISLGVPAGVLVLEEGSRTTQENAAFAARLLQGEVLVVSDSYHAFRCRRMFGRHFEHADAVGVSPSGWPRVRLALREVLAVVRHGLAGRL